MSFVYRVTFNEQEIIVEADDEAEAVERAKAARRSKESPGLIVKRIGPLVKK